MNFSFRFYLGVLIRRLPVMLAMILVCSAFGIVTAINLPPTYSTSARLLVESPQIPEGMAASMVSTSASEQLSIIEQRLMTRANLIDIANKFDVFENIREMNPDQVIERMRQNSSIGRTGGRDQATLMTVRFEAFNGNVAANVVNEFVTKILQSNSDFRLSRAEGALSFFEQEVERLGADLDIQSAKIVAFKSSNEGALPDDLEFRLGRQSLLQERLSRLDGDRAAAKSQRQEVIRIFESTGRIQQGGGQDLSTPDEIQLRDFTRQLAELQTVFSDTNPRVTLLKRQIERVEAAIASEAAVVTSNSTDEALLPSLLDVSLAEIDGRLKRAETEIESTRAELDLLAFSLAATASNAIALSALERDYNNIQLQYNSAVANLSEAQIGERIEVTSQGQRITVIEGANVPQEPSGPNRVLIASAGVGAGVALAAGFFMLLELLNFSIRRPAEIESRFGIRPIASIPYIESRSEKYLRRGLLMSALVLVLVGVPAALWYVDSNIMPLEIVAAKIINWLGI